MKVFVIDNITEEIKAFRATIDESVILKLTEQEREQIGSMSPDAKGFYAQFDSDLLAIYKQRLMDKVEEKC